MFNNKKKIILVFAISIIMYFLYNGISPFLKEKFLGRSKKVSACDKLSWVVLKGKIISDTANDDELYALYGLADKCRFIYKLKSSDINKILESFEKSKNIYTKRAILTFLSKVYDKDLVRENLQVRNLLKSIAIETENQLSVVSMSIFLNQFKPSFDELLNMFQSTKNRKIKIVIISNIYDYNTPAKDLDKIKTFLQTLVESKDKKIAAKSFALLTSIEGAEKWQSWQWSDWVNKKISQASEGDFYLLSEFGSLAMLEITRKYPNSKFTKSCIEFRSPFPGDTFFKGGSTDGFRRPFFYEKELSMHDDFIRKYSSHPALNDIVYRKARAYEFKEQFDKSIIHYYDSLKFGDTDEFSYYALPRIFFITNFLMDHSSIEKFINNNKNHPLNPYLSYTQVIHSMKENKIDTAKLEIESFIAKYQTSNTLLKQYTSLSPDFQYFQYTSIEKEFYDTYFWSEVKK
jgi:hypothetical protein